MKAIVPFKVINAKSRLSSLLTVEERTILARLMLQDITRTLKDSGLKVTLLTTMPFEWDAEIIVSEKDLNSALNDFLCVQDEPVMIVMADVPLISHKNVADMLNSPAEIVISPGRGGGTNVQFIRHPKKYHVDYYGASFLDHVRIAADNGLSVEVFDSFNTSSDIDEVGDLVELYIHGKGDASRYLRSITKLDTSKGRVKVVRGGEEGPVTVAHAPAKKYAATE
ncbi:2-phospho-L-lactate guanylyltransferase [Methanocella sp. CWC-04]|uniref:2-phospho-L-lactate guanylyltransferase n=1 Tax=Methanooceanicella nereidis TaxID=2052831 RepID=A0AAP2RG90_9EURY|nr:2-phospho-L-lactate guanylyltransferase [Methanocella sp. CWC-04]MCD1296226.1 2-phospho-L-lactate guanylyltransferase [Methanocella sp. CWC-04]